jgi:hypothetical protein
MYPGNFTLQCVITYQSNFGGSAPPSETPTASALVHPMEFLSLLVIRFRRQWASPLRPVGKVHYVPTNHLPEEREMKRFKLAAVLVATAGLIAAAFLVAESYAQIPNRGKSSKKGSASRGGPVFVLKGGPHAQLNGSASDAGREKMARFDATTVRTREYGGPVFPVYVASTRNLNQSEKTLYQQMAMALSGRATVPVDRTNYYSSLAGLVQAWEGIITEVEPINGGGNFVTMTVVPLFSMPKIVQTDYSEQYTVAADGTIQYSGFLDPNNWAGNSPILAEF